MFSLCWCFCSRSSGCIRASAEPQRLVLQEAADCACKWRGSVCCLTRTHTAQSFSSYNLSNQTQQGWNSVPLHHLLLVSINFWFVIIMTEQINPAPVPVISTMCWLTHMTLSISVTFNLSAYLVLEKRGCLFHNKLHLCWMMNTRLISQLQTVALFPSNTETLCRDKKKKNTKRTLV